MYNRYGALDAEVSIESDTDSATVPNGDFTVVRGLQFNWQFNSLLSLLTEE